MCGESGGIALPGDLPKRGVFWAYTFGRGVLATRTGSFPEAVEENKSGWLVEVEDVDGLEQSLIRILKDPGKLAEAGKYARHLAATHYDWRDITRQTVQVYESNRVYEDES